MTLLTHGVGYRKPLNLERHAVLLLPHLSLPAQQQAARFHSPSSFPRTRLATPASPAFLSSFPRTRLAATSSPASPSATASTASTALPHPVTRFRCGVTDGSKPASNGASETEHSDSSDDGEPRCDHRTAVQDQRQRKGTRITLQLRREKKEKGTGGGDHAGARVERETVML